MGELDALVADDVAERDPVVEMLFPGFEVPGRQDLLGFTVEVRRRETPALDEVDRSEAHAPFLGEGGLGLLSGAEKLFLRDVEPDARAGGELEHHIADEGAEQALPHRVPEADVEVCSGERHVPDVEQHPEGVKLPGDQHGLAEQGGVGGQPPMIVRPEGQRLAGGDLHLDQDGAVIDEVRQQVGDLVEVPGRRRSLELVELVHQTAATEPGADHGELVLGGQPQVQELDPVCEGRGVGLHAQFHQGILDQAIQIVRYVHGGTSPNARRRGRAVPKVYVREPGLKSGRSARNPPPAGRV